MSKYLIIFFLFFSFSLQSQNYLFEQGQSGFGIGGQLTSFEGSTLIGFLPSYTINGKLNLGLTIGFEDGDGDLNSTAIRPNASFLILKQGEDNNPVSVGLNSALQYNTFSNIDDFTSITYGLGATIHHEIKAHETIKVIPGFALGWNRINFYFDGDKLDDDSAIVYGILGTVAFNQFYVEPSLFFSEGNSQFSFLLGYIFPK